MSQQKKSTPSDSLKAAYTDLVRFGFRLLYNEMAFTYDTVSWLVSMGQWRSWQRATLKHLAVQPGMRVVEIAHGTANLQLDLHHLGIESVGIDLSSYMGRIAYRRLTENHINPKLVRGRAQALPFPSQAFDAVVSTFPTEFIVDAKTIAEVYRILKPDGRLVFVMSGELMSGGLAKQGIELAYRATGQDVSGQSVTSENMLHVIRITERFDQAGFTLSHVAEPCDNSIAHVFIAEKKAAE